MKDEFVSKVPIDTEDSLLYLGHVISQKGDNINNIIHKRNKIIGTQKKIPKLVENMGCYTFEGAVIYMQSLLRSSILYAGETMYNITEKEYRTLESIEKSTMIKILKVKVSCPRLILYLDLGILPDRHQLRRMKLNFLQYILQQPPESMFQAEIENPVKGDWASEVTELVKEYKIDLSLSETKDMSENKYKNLVKNNVTETALVQMTAERILSITN